MRNHTCVISFKTSKCLAFSVERCGKKLCFMDDEKTIFVCRRIPDSRSFKVERINQISEVF